jgi:hypothetical protein
MVVRAVLFFDDRALMYRVVTQAATVPGTIMCLGERSEADVHKGFTRLPNPRVVRTAILLQPDETFSRRVADDADCLRTSYFLYIVP